MGRPVSRRRFLGSASVGAAAVAFGGSALLEACGKKDDDGSGATGTTGSPTTAAGGGGTDTTTGGTGPVVYRLSTRSNRGCTACEKHAHSRSYVSQEAAEADRAHPGCNCRIRTQHVDAAALATMFKDNATVFDKRSQ